MFGIGTGELVVVLLIIFLIYGPEKLPELAKKLGSLSREFRKTSDQVNTAVRREIDQLKPPPASPPSDDKPN